MASDLKRHVFHTAAMHVPEDIKFKDKEQELMFAGLSED